MILLSYLLNLYSWEGLQEWFCYYNWCIFIAGKVYRNDYVILIVRIITAGKVYRNNSVIIIVKSLQLARFTGIILLSYLLNFYSWQGLQEWPCLGCPPGNAETPSVLHPCRGTQENNRFYVCLLHPFNRQTNLYKLLELPRYCKLSNLALHCFWKIC